jgi:hypothetical protein
VSLPEAVSSPFRALRGYDLAPIGAILVVVILAAGIYLVLTNDGERSYPEKVRAYFMSSAGGSATKDEARRIEVSTCLPTGSEVGNALVISCSVSFGSQSLTSCYAWDGDKLIAGGNRPPIADAYLGCEPVLWDRRRHALVGLGEGH